MPQNVGTVSTTLLLDTRQALQQYNRFQQTVTRGSSGRNSMFGAISADAKEFDSSLGKATNRVVAFGAAAAIFTGVARATRAFAESIVEVDKNLAAINVNLGQSDANLKKFGANIFNVARQTGQTFEVASEAAAELARQGLSAEETIKRLKDALILSRIAGLDSAASVSALTAAINSFNKEALTSSEIVNKFAAVDTRFAVSSKDLAEAVSRVGSTAQAAGVGIDQLIGLVTSLQQTTARGGSVIGNGLRTIFTRIQASPETVNALEGIGVAIKNTDGSLRDGVSILKDYAAARDRVGEAERAALDNTVAGMRQINILKALLGDITKQYSIYGNAVNTASNATDEAIRKNAQLNQTISSLLNSVGQSIKQLFADIGDQKIGGIFKELLRNIESVRSFLSGDSGNQLGESLGNGIIKGLSNVLGGPALIALAVVLANAFKKVIFTIAQEARTLLTINGTVQARANIQKQINILLGQATVAERAQYAAASSVLAKKEQILAIQARINQEELVGSSLVRSFQVAGPLGIGARVDPKIRRGNSYLGGAPNYANPLSNAINREKAAGVAPKDIYVDRDPRVANFANPLGLLVANRRDEPLGGYQGVNRVIAEGGNPKTAGMAPNFAAPGGSAVESYNASREIRSLFLALSRAKPLSEEFNKIGSQIQDASSKLGRAARENALGKLARQFNQALISTKVITDQSRFAPYIPPTVGTLDESRAIMDRNIARTRQRSSSSSQPFGPAYPINPALQARLGARAQEIAYANAGIEPGTDYASPIGPPTYQQNRRQQLLAMTGRFRARRAQAEQIRQRNQNRALGAAFILPFLAGGIEPGAQALGVNTGGRTAGGIATGALGGAAQGAGIGGIFGPAGLGIGAVIGGLVGVFGKLKKSAEEYAAETEKAAAQRGAENDALAKYITIQEELNDAIKSGAGGSVITRLRGALGQAAGGVTSRAGAAIIAEQNPEKRAALLAANERDIAQQNARDTLSLSIRQGKLPGAKDFQSGFTPEFTSSLSLTQKQALGRAATGNFDVQASVGVVGAKTGQTNLVEAAAAQEAFKKSLEEVTPILKDFVDVSTITPKNLNKIAQSFRSALVRFKSIQDIIGGDKAPLLGRLPTNAFVNAPNLDVYKQAALTGRNPRASQGSRAQADFAFYQELISSGVTNEKVLEGDPGYKKAKAGTQRENALKAAATLLQSNNPNVGRLTNNLGDYSGTSIERQLEFLASAGVHNSGKARLALDFVKRSGETAEDAGINNLSYGPNFDASASGLAPGQKYEVRAGDALKAAQATVEKTLQMANSTIIRSQLSIDGTVRVLTSDVLSSDALQKAAADMTAAIGQQFQAKITDLNVRLSKIEGRPVPPSQVPNDNVFGNKMVKGSDSFIRSAPTK